MKAINITGLKFGKLLAIGPEKSRTDGRVLWKCLCDCGNYTFKPASRLVSAGVMSCGCLGKTQLVNPQFPEQWESRLERHRRYHAAYRKIHNSTPSFLKSRRIKERAYFAADPEYYKTKNKISYNRNILARRIGAKKSRESRKHDPVRLLKYRRWCVNNVRHKKKTDPQFRLRFLMRNRIWMALQRGVAKAGSTVDLVGCSMAEYKSHLESLWLPGMSWSNYGRGHGKWHIDHKQPCESFDLRIPEQQKKCFHFSNTQPLWAIDNLSKGKNR